jgi:hypothetical protein
MPFKGQGAILRGANNKRLPLQYQTDTINSAIFAQIKLIMGYFLRSEK